MIRAKALTLLILAMALTARTASAQFAFADKLLGRVTDGSVFTTTHVPFSKDRVLPTGLVTKQGYGCELLFFLGRSGGGAKDTTYTVAAREVTYPVGATDGNGRRRDSTVVVKYTAAVEPNEQATGRIHDLGISYVEVPFSVSLNPDEVPSTRRNKGALAAHPTSSSTSIGHFLTSRTE